MLFPVSQLIEGRDPPLCIARSATVQDALVLMIKHDYSQLPVIDEAGDLRGIISEQTITRTYYHVGGSVALHDLTVDNCMVPVSRVTPESDIFEALDLLKDAYAVVVVKDSKPIGILTHYDTTHFFRDLSEDLIWVEDIELSLRQYIEAAFPDEGSLRTGLMCAFGPDKRDSSKPARAYEELSLGEYIQLAATEKNWPRFASALEPKKLFQSWMTQVRDIRNQLAHFRGQLEPTQRDALRKARVWLENRPSLVTAGSERGSLIRVPVPEEACVQPEGKYSALECWLRDLRPQENRIRVGFQDLEALLSQELPRSAREHRSWWANDSTSHVQALAWLRAGWRVADVDLETQEVTFQKTDTALMQIFFADLLGRLKAERPGITEATKTQAQSWWSFGAGKTGFSFGWVFSGTGNLRVELYIDAGDRKQNKAAFDTLLAQRADVEREIARPLDWDRLDNRRASRISASFPARITDPPDRLEEAQQWALDMMLRFVYAFRRRVIEL
jgi:CBS domain-containing protein